MCKDNQTSFQEGEEECHCLPGLCPMPLLHPLPDFDLYLTVDEEDYDSEDIIVDENGEKILFLTISSSDDELFSFGDDNSKQGFSGNCAMCGTEIPFGPQMCLECVDVM